MEPVFPGQRVTTTGKSGRGTHIPRRPVLQTGPHTVSTCTEQAHTCTCKLYILILMSAHVLLVLMKEPFHKWFDYEPIMISIFMHTSVCVYVCVYVCACACVLHMLICPLTDR